MFVFRVLCDLDVLSNWDSVQWILSCERLRTLLYCWLIFVGVLGADLMF